LEQYDVVLREVFPRLGVLLAGPRVSVRGQHAEAEKFQREALEIERRVPGPNSRDDLITTTNLENNVCYQGLYAEAAKVWREAVDLGRRAFGQDHPVRCMPLPILAELSR
jgi:hypothetical protein